MLRELIYLFDYVQSLTRIETLGIDNYVSVLHYKVTVYILVDFGIMLTLMQYFGDPINCIVDDIPPIIMNTYCWIYSTFTVSNLPSESLETVKKDLVHSGDGSYIAKEDKDIYHKYYQWVYIVLMLQAIFFYIPRLLWRLFECGGIKTLLLDLIDSVETSKENGNSSLVYFKENAGSHNTYFYKFFFCELLNLLNVIGQIFFTDFFLGGEFLNYGLKVSQHNSTLTDDGVDFKFVIGKNHMAEVFPIVTHCAFHKFGPSGSLQKFKGVCMLPINILNEKIYLILWFWFIILTIITAILLIYRILIISSHSIRLMVLVLDDKEIDQKALIQLTKNIDDWFILKRLKSNTDSIMFREVVAALDRDSSV